MRASFEEQKVVNAQLMRSKNREEIKDFLSLAKKHELINSFIVNAAITRSTQINDLVLVKEIFFETADDMKTAVTYNVFLSALKKFELYQEAKLAYFLACAKKKTNVKTHMVALHLSRISQDLLFMMAINRNAMATGQYDFLYLERYKFFARECSPAIKKKFNDSSLRSKSAVQTAPPAYNAFASNSGGNHVNSQHIFFKRPYTDSQQTEHFLVTANENNHRVFQA